MTARDKMSIDVHVRIAFYRSGTVPIQREQFSASSDQVFQFAPVMVLRICNLLVRQILRMSSLFVPFTRDRKCTQGDSKYSPNRATMVKFTLMLLQLGCGRLRLSHLIGFGYFHSLEGRVWPPALVSFQVRESPLALVPALAAPVQHHLRSRSGGRADEATKVVRNTVLSPGKMTR